MQQAEVIGSDDEKKLINDRINSINKILNAPRASGQNLSEAEIELINDAASWENGRQKMHEDFERLHVKRISERDALKMQLQAQEKTVSQNRQLFGQGAKTRKAAKEQIARINAELKKYSDLK